MVRRNDRQPSDPDVDRELDDLLILIPLVGADTLDRRQGLCRNVGVLGYGGYTRRIGRLVLADLVLELVEINVSGAFATRAMRSRK